MEFILSGHAQKPAYTHIHTLTLTNTRIGPQELSKEVVTLAAQGQAL